MQKQFNWLIVLLISLISISISSCKEEDNNDPELATIDIIGSNKLTVSSEGGTVNVRFTSDCQWVLEPSNHNPNDDVVMTPTSGGTGYNAVSVKIPKNQSTYELYFTFLLRDTKTGGIIATFSVTQEAGNFYIECDTGVVDLPYEDCETVIPVLSNHEIEVCVRDEDRSWLDAYIVKASDVHSNRYSLHIQALKPSYEQGRVRAGRITLNAAEIQKNIHVLQKCSD
ncbi:MAG: BACON domain-containing protein [Bacteroides sp.]|nr:BACON domain-containing protein [Bacteroides sp.]